MGCGSTTQPKPSHIEHKDAPKTGDDTQKTTTEVSSNQVSPLDSKEAPTKQEEAPPSDSKETSTKLPPSDVLPDTIDNSAPPKVDGDGTIDPELVPRLLTHDEREKAWSDANFYNASSGHKRPIALWILGPSSVGKSSLREKFGPKFEIPHLDDCALGAVERQTRLNAVIIDGEFIRDAHGVWQRWTKTPDWRSAYPTMKSIFIKEKDHMATEAAAQRKHVVFPETSMNLQKNLDEVEGLIWQGYTHHVVAVVAPLDECQRRGKSRELTTGKRYTPMEYQKSILGMSPMITACNGNYDIVQAVENEDGKTMDFRILSTGRCRRHEEFINAPLSPFTDEELHSIIDDAIKIKQMEHLKINDGMNVAVGITRLLSPRATHKLCPLQRAVTDLDAGLVPRPFQEEERKEAWAGANCFSASTGHEHPIAVWILGPSSVGKKDLTAQLATMFEISLAKDANTDVRKLLDAVVVDGDCFRDAYGVWESWMKSPERQFAYRALKSAIDKEKAAMCEDAISKRQNLVIPATMLNLSKGLTEMAELTRSGYINHIAAVVAPADWCKQRGQEVEVQKGKGYRAEDFDASIAAIIPMISACNGRFEIVRPVKADPKLGDTSEMALAFDSIAKGSGSSGARDDDLGELAAIIQKVTDPAPET